MAKSKALIAAEARIAELEPLLAQRDERIAALESKVSLARTLYRKLRDDITPVVRPSPQPRSCAHAVTPVVTQFYDAQGRLWIKTRIGGRATSRLANASSVAEHDDDFVPGHDDVGGY